MYMYYIPSRNIPIIYGLQRYSTATLSKRSMKTTHLLFSLFKDVIDVFLCDLAVLGSKHVTGTVSNHVQHLIFTQFVCTRIHQATCKDTPTLIKLQSMSPPTMGSKIYFSQNKASSMCTLLYDHVIQAELHFSLFHDSFLHCVLCDEPEHLDLLLLTDTMGSILDKWTSTTFQAEFMITKSCSSKCQGLLGCC